MRKTWQTATAIPSASMSREVTVALAKTAMMKTALAFAAVRRNFIKSSVDDDLKIPGEHPGLRSWNSNVRLRFFSFGHLIFSAPDPEKFGPLKSDFGSGCRKIGSGSRKILAPAPEKLAPAPEKFGPLKTDSLPANYVCGIGIQISGSGSIMLNILAPAPAVQNCFGSGSAALTVWM